MDHKTFLTDRRDSQGTDVKTARSKDIGKKANCEKHNAAHCIITVKMLNKIGKNENLVEICISSID